MRLRTVDITAWLVLAASTVVLPVSALAALMLLAGVDGTANAGIVDTFAVVFAPPLAFVAAIGVLRRNRIAWQCLIGLLLLATLHFGWAYATANPETTQERRADGVLVTTMGSDPATNLPWLAACVLLLVPLLTPGARALFRPSSRDAAAGANVGGNTGALRHPLVSPAAAPAAATANATVRAAARARDARAATAPAATPVLHASSPAATQGLPALYLVITLFVGTATGTGWLLLDGLRSGETWLPGARPSQARIVSRADEPVSYWLALGLYGLVASAAVAGTLWLVRNARGTSRR